MENIQVNATASEVASSRIEQFKFSGKGSEYFGIWIVNILLTIVTLGIYSAWAKVRNKQYFYGNTTLNNASFEYTANPINILKGRIIAVIALVAYQISASYTPTISLILLVIFAVLIPWVIMKSFAFNARYSQYRNIRFHFNQDAFDAYKIMLLIPLAGYIALAVLIGIFTFIASANESASVGIGLLGGLIVFAGFFALFPYLLFIMARYKVSNHNYGQSNFKFGLNDRWAYHAIYLKLIGLLFLGFFLFAIIITAIASFFPSLDFGSFNPDKLNTNNPAFLFIYAFLIIFYALIYVFMIAYVKARTYNLVYNHTSIGGHSLQADMSVRGLTFLYITNTLAIILTIGFFTPWAKVRTAQFKAKHTSLNISGSMDDFINNQETNQAALGEEVGEVFDLDIGI